MSRSRFLVSLVLVGSLLHAPAQGQEFRVETDIFVGSQKKPIAQSLTLFTSGLVYDFPLAGPNEITVLDTGRGRFVLLDVQRKVKTTLSTQEILEFTASLKAEAAEADGAVAFAAHPRFELSFDEQSDWLTLSSKVLTYRMRGSAPKQASAVETYRQFADWYARLNATRPGNLPPFARLELNKATAARGLIPEEVELTVVPPNLLTGRKLVVRSHHLVNWLLSNTDRKRVDEAGKYLADFQTVGFREYRNTAPLAAKP